MYYIIQNAITFRTRTRAFPSFNV